MIKGETWSLVTVRKCPAPGDLDIVQSVAGDGAGLHPVCSLEEAGDVAVGEKVGVLPAGGLTGLAGVVRHTLLPLSHTVLRYEVRSALHFPGRERERQTLTALQVVNLKFFPWQVFPPRQSLVAVRRPVLPLARLPDRE